MKDRATLLIRIVRTDGSRTYAKPVVGSNHHLKPLWAIVDGKAGYHPEGIYYLRFTAHGKRSFRNVGKNATEARVALERHNHALKGLAIGVTCDDLLPKPLPAEAIVTGPERVTWEAATHNYMLEIETRKRKRTALAYAAALEGFASLCPVTYLDQITRNDLLAYEAAILKKKNSKRTAFNRVSYLCTFLRKFGFVPLPQKDLPTYTETDPTAYDTEEMNRLMVACKPEDRLLFETFLHSGLREQEMMYLAAKDLDVEGKSLKVREKLDVGFEIKDHKERSVPISDAMVMKLQAHCAQRPGQRFMFFTKQGKPDGHFLRRLKRIALGAGLNCGRCVNKKKLSCDKHPVCERWDLHKFRRTFATWHHEAGVSARTLMAWLGHEDLQTVLKYLAVADQRSAATRAAVNRTFSNLAA
jgi:integrase